MSTEQDADNDEIESFEPTSEQLKLLKGELLAPKPDDWREFTEEEYEDMRQRMKAQAKELRQEVAVAQSQTFMIKTLANLNKTEPYSPCPCGSGAKFKFCCKNK